MDVTLSSDFVRYLLDTLKALPQEYNPDIEELRRQLKRSKTIYFPTGIPDIDYEIMVYLDDETLLNSCKINRYTADLCRNENFWHKKIIQKFGHNISKYKPEGLTYKQIYLKLGNPDDTDFYEAIKLGLFPIVKDIWENKYHGDVSNLVYIRNLKDSLSVAAQNGYIDTVIYIIDNFRNINILENFPYKTLITKERYELLKVLLEKYSNRTIVPIIKALTKDTLSDKKRRKFLSLKYLRKDDIFEYIRDHSSLTYNFLKSIIDIYNIPYQDIIKLLSMHEVRPLVQLVEDYRIDPLEILDNYKNLRTGFLEEYLAEEIKKDETYALPDHYLAHAIKNNYEPLLIKIIYRNSITERNKVLYKEYLAKQKRLAEEVKATKAASEDESESE